MLYHLYDLQHAALTPMRLWSEIMRAWYQQPWNPLSYTQMGRTMGAGAEMFERATRRFGRPEWEIHETLIGGRKVEVLIEDVIEKPFCTLTHFKRRIRRDDPKVLLVAPMSGHFATLLRGTVEGLIEHHDVYVTEWTDARQVPLSEGRFNLDDYINYLRQFMSLLGPDTHIIAVCQPAVPVLASVSLMAAENDPNQPLSMTLMGGPIDTRISKTQVTELAENRSIRWFEQTVTTGVPCYYPGAFRKVYPGFLQLGGFMSMNLDRHVGKHLEFYRHLVVGDGESAEAHRKFYNEYMAVMDISADFYLQTVETVFQRHLLPKGKMKWRDPLTNILHDVDPSAIRHTALMTVEGELDDISAHGQTTAAHDLCSNLSPSKHFHHFQENVGHYGIFNGRRWKTEIMPRIRDFIRRNDKGRDSVPEQDATPKLKAQNWDKKTMGIDAVRKRLSQKAEQRKIKNAEKNVEV